MSGPFDSFQQGLMTGRQLGTDMRERRNSRELGGLMASGDYTGAANRAYGQGNLAQGLGIEQAGRQRADRARQEGVGTALAGGDFDAATTAAGGDVALLGQIRQWKAQASEQELAQARREAGNYVSVLTAIGSIQDPAERLAAAQRYAPQFGMNPADILPEHMSPEFLAAQRYQALGIEDALAYEDRVADNRRLDEQFAETRRHNQATEGVAQARVGVSRSRESRVAAGRSSGGTARPSGARPVAAPARKPWERF